MSDKILAIVDGEEIKESDRTRIIERYPMEKRVYFEATDQGKDQLLDQMVAFKLMSRYAKSLGIDQREEYLRKIKELQEQILTQIVMSEMFSTITVSDEEVKELYEANQNAFEEKESIDVEHILVEDEQEIICIKNAIEKGETSFEDAASKHSICPSKEREGSLGLVHRGMMVEEFEKVAFALPINRISDVVKTQFGYHLIRVKEKFEGRMRPLEEVKEMISSQIQSQKQQKLYEEKQEELKKMYKVEIVTSAE
ncbi:peptidylprolyl isomerase [Rubeoparvulum massiliense]|uniref:peptidylprolyl isomerase n=1 Tax=Rubeoparvulum massiliense TaxID=1631346 RepID=UPI00065E7F7B|nr:peptidylprolyl isomerase [Rubeoparvulum massiliense]